MARESSQKFIARNRAPRVQIEYDVETYGSQKKVQLPFVVGVLSDLAGRSNALLPDLEGREMFDIDVENFDARMRALQPRVQLSVPNKLTGQGTLPIDLTFECIEDFSPGAIARNVESLNRLLEARSQLANLLTYMDGKTGAEELIGDILSNAGVLKTLAGPDQDGSVVIEYDAGQDGDNPSLKSGE